MAGAIRVEEAVRLAKEAMGAALPEELAAWIVSHHGLTVKPVIVKVMLGLFQYRDSLEQSRLKALELAKMLPAAGAAEKPSECAAPTPAVQSHAAQKHELPTRKPLGIRGCPECKAEDYVFRGRKKDKPQEGEPGPMIVTKFHCRGCGHQWKVRQAG